MTVRLYGCVCGHLTCSRSLMGEPSEEIVRVPVPFYVIEHPEGAVLFDSGLAADMDDPENPTRKVLAKFPQEVDVSPAESTTARLEALDLDPGSVRFVVLSHLHYDHAGGLGQIPNAKVVIQAREWAIGLDPELAAKNFFNPADYDLGHAVWTVDGEQDLFGDGRIVCLPTPGHTPGHQSLRVRSEAGDHILTADACYFCRIMETRTFTPSGDHEAMNRSLDTLLKLRGPETVMVYGHDPDQWGEHPVIPTARA